MPLEWSVAGLLLAAALWPLVRKTRSWRTRAGLTFLISAAALGGFAWKSRANNKIIARQQFSQTLPAESRPGGYAKSDACRSCHPDQYASWHKSYHRTMTQRATPEAVRGAFNNVTLTLENEVFHLSRHGDAFWIEMVDPDWKYLRALQEEDFERGRGPKPAAEASPPRVEKRVTLTTGSHHMQAYWVAGKYGNQQFNFPFTYLFEEQRWVPRNDVFMLPPGTPHLQQVWNNNCLGCHATAGQPQQDPKTFVHNSRAAELGVACEACHGPAEKHLQTNKSLARRYSRHRGMNGDSTITNPARVSAKKASEICSQCHAARSIENQEEWMMVGLDYWQRSNPAAGRSLLPGKDLQFLTNLNDPRQAAAHRSLSAYFWNDGMIRVSGREYNGLSETPCFQKGDLSCLSCHSMHKMTSTDDQLAVGMESNRACYQCHAGFEKKLAQHTHHAASSSGSLCYNCHMPHTTYGLLKAIRSHQITSPSVKTSIDTGRPNACNLCHLDRTLDWSARQLNAWYNQPVPAIEPAFTDQPASVTWLLRGDAGQRALVAWHMGWDSARQASGTNWLVPYLAETLDDPYSAVRYIGQRSLKRIGGFEHLSYDFIAPNEQRLQAKSRLLQRWNPDQLPVGERAKVLLPRQMSQLLDHRDHRPVELFE